MATSPIANLLEVVSGHKHQIYAEYTEQLDLVKHLNTLSQPQHWPYLGGCAVTPGGIPGNPRWCHTLGYK